jgi:hypothetical protein
MPDVEHQVRAVVSNARGETQFSVIWLFIHQLVVCLWCAEGVPVQAIPGVLLGLRRCAWLWEAIIEKASVIVCPGNASKPTLQEAFGVILAGIDVAHVDDLPIATALGEGVRQEGPIVADGPIRYRDCAV